MNDILLDFLTSEYQKDIRYETWVVKKVISCETCKGTGYTSREELTDYHRREYDVFTDKCHKCKGDGRLTEKTENLRFNAIYPIESPSTKRVTVVPYSEDPIELEWVSDFLKGSLKAPKRKEPEDLPF